MMTNNAGKSTYLRDKQLTPADAVRQSLRSLEERLPKLKNFPTGDVRLLLEDLDRVYLGLEQLQQAGVDVRSEKVRLEAIEGAVRKAAPRLLRQLGGAEPLRQARPVPTPAAARWWWYLDARVARARRKRREQQLIVGGIVTLAFVTVIALFQTVLKPDPKVIGRLKKRDAALAAMQAGDYGEALQIVEAGLAEAPDDLDFQVLRVITLEQLGRPAEVERAMTEASQRLGLEEFYLIRGQYHFQAGLFEPGRKDAQAILALEPESAEGWFLLAITSQALGNPAEAREAYERAADLARVQGNQALFVQARLNLGTLSGPLAP
jgi:tetratricopeptide (TPR) repeat protein